MTKVIFNSLQSKVFHWGSSVFWTATVLLCFGSMVFAAEEKPKPEEPIFNPLEITAPDPLLPKLPKGGRLTPEQQATLRAALDELNARAAALLQEGKADEAFEIWYRELRLRRRLGPVEEVRALGRAGEIAWQRNRKSDMQVISKRLGEIQTQAEQKKLLNLELSQAFAQAYQQMRFPERAASMYELILADQRQQGDTAAQEETEKTLVQLYLDRFDYQKAAAVYEQLLDRAQANGDRVSELAYLEQLNYIYSKAQQPQNALRMKQQLVATYPPNDPRLPAMKIAIATDYEAIKELDNASKNYQEAYKLAWSLQQFAYAGEALQKLAALYRSHNQPQYALQVYDVLLKTQQQAYNFYGLMNTYDQMGQIYLEQKQYAQALNAFQKGLELAKSLQYQETYFANQIEQVNQQNSQ